MRSRRSAGTSSRRRRRNGVREFAAIVRLMTGLAWAERAGHEVAQTIAELRGLAAAWLRPPGRRPRITTTPMANLLFHMAGWSYAILLTRAQAKGTCREAQWARRRLASWPWQLARQILTPDAQARAATADWMQAQARVLTHATCHEAVVYAMTAATTVYIGVTTQCAPGAGQRTLGLPSIRGWQHLPDVQGAGGSGTRHKRHAFGKAPVGTLTWWSIAGGTARCMRALERVLIRMLAPSGNNTHALAGGWRRQPEALEDNTGGQRRQGRRRGRPPPRLRSRNRPAEATQVGPLEAAVASLPGAILGSAAWEKRQDRAALVERALNETYEAAYNNRATLLPELPIGPVDIAAPEAHPLLVSMMATRKAGTPIWRWITRRAGTAPLYRVGATIERLQRRGRQLLAARRWAATSRALEELPWTLPPLMVPPDLREAGRRIIRRRIAQQLSGGCVWRARWVSEVLRTVMAPRETHARSLVNAPRAAEMDIEAIRTASEEEKRTALEGKGFEQYKYYLKVPRHRTRQEIEEHASECMRAWWRRARIPRTTSGAQKAAERKAREIAHEAAAEGVVQPLPLARKYAEQFPAKAHDRVIAPEDKDRSASWSMPTLVYGICALLFLIHDGAWKESPLSLEEAAMANASLFRHAIDAGMAPQVQAGR